MTRITTACSRLIAVSLCAVCATAPHASAQGAGAGPVAVGGGLESPVGAHALRDSRERVPAEGDERTGTAAMGSGTPGSPQRRADVWRDLFGATWTDVRRFPSKQTLGWIAVGAAATAATRPADSHVGRSLSSAAPLHEISEPGAYIGSTPLQLGLSAAAYGLGRATHSPRMAALGADLFRAQLLAQGLTVGIKEGVRRQRPEGGGFAFPSGHSTVSFASATVLQQHLGWRVGVPAYALASYVALSRVQMQRHYLSDVAFGAALGIAAGRTITLDRERRIQLAPMATAGGAGVQVVWDRSR